MADETNTPTTATGLPENTEAALAYVLGWVSGLILLLLNKESKVVKYHAWQSLILFGLLHITSIVIGLIPLLGLVILPFFGLASFVLWLVMIVQTYQGKTVNLPIVTDLVKKQVGK